MPKLLPNPSDSLPESILSYPFLTCDENSSDSSRNQTPLDFCLFPAIFFMVPFKIKSEVHEGDATNLVIVNLNKLPNFFKPCLPHQ